MDKYDINRQHDSTSMDELVGSVCTDFICVYVPENTTPYASSTEPPSPYKGNSTSINKSNAINHYYNTSIDDLIISTMKYNKTHYDYATSDKSPLIDIKENQFKYDGNISNINKETKNSTHKYNEHIGIIQDKTDIIKDDTDAIRKGDYDHDYGYSSFKEDYSAFYIKLNGVFYRFFIETGVLFWRSDIEPDEEYDTEDGSIYVNLGEMFNVINREVEYISYEDPVLSIKFSGRDVIIFKYEFRYNSDDSVVSLIEF